LNKGATFLKDLMKGYILNLHTSMPCKVLEFDANEMTAKIQPLYKYKERNQEPVTRSPVEGVPVLYQRFKTVDTRATSEDPLQYSDKEVIREFTPVLEQGDVVMVVFSERALDEVMGGSVAYPSSGRRHNLNDAVIIGLIS